MITLGERCLVIQQSKHFICINLIQVKLKKIACTFNNPFLETICNMTFHNKLIFCGEELLAPPPQLEDHPLLAVYDCLFNILEYTEL
jgi:hypothetical protein